MKNRIIASWIKIPCGCGTQETNIWLHSTKECIALSYWISYIILQTKFYDLQLLKFLPFCVDFQTWDSAYCPDGEKFVSVGSANLEMAQIYCAKDDTCYGVYDPKCDNYPPFKLCKSNYKVKSKYTPCTYSKIGKQLRICRAPLDFWK